MPLINVPVETAQLIRAVETLLPQALKDHGVDLFIKGKMESLCKIDLLLEMQNLMMMKLL